MPEKGVRLGDRIRALRQERQWTITYLSKEMGHNTRSFVSRIENNTGDTDLGLPVIRRFARIFGLTVRELLDGVDLDAGELRWAPQCSDFTGPGTAVLCHWGLASVVPSILAISTLSCDKPLLAGVGLHPRPERR